MPVEKNGVDSEGAQKSIINKICIFTLICIIVMPAFFNVHWILQNLWSKYHRSSGGSLCELRGISLEEIKEAREKYPEELFAQYETVAQEIQTRIKHEHNLFWYQFIVLGSVPAFAIANYFKRKESLESMLRDDMIIIILGLMSLALLAISSHLTFNSKIINELGIWVSEILEPNQVFWEHFHNLQFSYFRSCIFPVAVGLLYLPSIIVLLAYYGLIFTRRYLNLDRKINKINLYIFGAVNLLVLYFTFNISPFTSILCYVCFIAYVTLWFVFSILGYRLH